MSIWSKILDLIDADGPTNATVGEDGYHSFDTSRYAFIDVEVGADDHKVYDIGALRYDDAIFHSASKIDFYHFIQDVDYLCGHNIVHHDAQYLQVTDSHRWQLVDTLYMSPLLFPERPYHKLVKDDKLLSEQINNPVNDCRKAKDLLWDEIEKWHSLSLEKRMIYTALLRGNLEFDGFLNMVGASEVSSSLSVLINEVFGSKICKYADIDTIINQSPCALAYALALIDTTDTCSITPGWVLHTYPEVEGIIKRLRHTPCKSGCSYCNTHVNIH